MMVLLFQSSLYYCTTMGFYWNLFLFVFYAVSFLIHLNGLTPFFYHKELADPTVNEWYTAACKFSNSKTMDIRSKKLN